jgi:hypothetical protein
MPKEITIPEAEDDEAASPDSKDIERADELAATNPVLEALWSAKPIEDKK